MYAATGMCPKERKRRVVYFYRIVEVIIVCLFYNTNFTVLVASFLNNSY